MSNPYASNKMEVEYECFEYFQKAGLDERKAKIAVKSILSLSNSWDGKPPIEELPRIYRENFDKKFEKLESELEALRPADKNRLKEDILDAVGRGLEGELTGPLTAPVEVALAGLDDPPDYAYRASELPDTGLRNKPVPSGPGSDTSQGEQATVRGRNSDGASDFQDSSKEPSKDTIESVNSVVVRKEIVRELYQNAPQSLSNLRSEVMTRTESGEEKIHANLDELLADEIVEEHDIRDHYPKQYSLTELGINIAKHQTLNS